MEKETYYEIVQFQEYWGSHVYKSLATKAKGIKQSKHNLSNYGHTIQFQFLVIISTSGKHTMAIFNRRETGLLGMRE